MADKKRDPVINVVMPKGAASYAYIDKPDTEGQYADGKHKVTVICEPGTDLSKQTAAILAGAKAKWPDLNEDEFQWPFKLNEPDAKKEAYAGMLTYTAKSKFPPRVMDHAKNDVPPTVKVFSGDIIKVGGSIYLYEKTEKVREQVVENGKTVGKMVDVLLRGASIQMSIVQLLEKRGGTSGPSADDFGDEDGQDFGQTSQSGDPGPGQGAGDGDF